MTVMGTARQGSLEEFLEFYQPGTAASWRSSSGSTLLNQALVNTKHRSEICNFLLDEGADAAVTIDPDGYNCLHVLLGRVLNKVHPENNPTDVALLQRLLDGGADINAVDRRDGTPVQYFSERMDNVPEEWVAIPFYDVLFSRPELDLLKIGSFKQSSYQTIWTSYDGKIFLQYAQHHMRQHGVEIPDLPPLRAPRIVS